MSQFGKYPQPKTSIPQTNGIWEWLEETNRRHSKLLQEILKESGASQEEIDAVDIDKQLEKEQKEFEEMKKTSSELLEKIRKENEFMLVPIQEGNIIKFENRRVSPEERFKALMQLADIVKGLKNGEIIPQSKNQQPTNQKIQ